MYYMYVIERTDSTGQRLNSRRACDYVGQGVQPADERFR